MCYYYVRGYNPPSKHHLKIPKYKDHLVWNVKTGDPMHIYHSKVTSYKYVLKLHTLIDMIMPEFSDFFLHKTSGKPYEPMYIFTK